MGNCKNCNKLGIDISNNTWEQYENAILSFLELERKPSPVHNRYKGRYVNYEYGFELKLTSLHYRTQITV
jgi:hypothetical protein